MAKVVKYPRQITIRLTEAQYRWLKAQARKKKVNESDILSDLIDEAMTRGSGSDSFNPHTSLTKAYNPSFITGYLNKLTKTSFASSKLIGRPKNRS